MPSRQKNSKMESKDKGLKMNMNSAVQQQMQWQYELHSTVK